MNLYSVKMRASRRGAHISGAERIVSREQIPAVSSALTNRALSHPHGVPDFLNVSVTEITDEIVQVPSLKVVEVASTSVADTRAFLTNQDVPPHALELLYSVTGLRGALLIDAHTGANLCPDPERGVRVSSMDHAESTVTDTKDYFMEAIALASKVAAHPHIRAELCISDDPMYTTGYLATKGTYFRLHHCKEPGAKLGTRVFLYDGPPDAVAATIDYLENTPVLVMPR